MAPHSRVLLPGKSHGWRSLVGCSPWGREESDTTERFHFHFSLSCIGEGNGNPLQCSCLENPRDGGAWWAAVYGVAQSQTWLKRLSSSSSSSSSRINQDTTCLENALAMHSKRLKSIHIAWHSNPLSWQMATSRTMGVIFDSSLSLNLFSVFWKS